MSLSSPVEPGIPAGPALAVNDGSKALARRRGWCTAASVHEHGSLWVLPRKLGESVMTSLSGMVWGWGGGEEDTGFQTLQERGRREQAGQPSPQS